MNAKPLLTTQAEPPRENAADLPKEADRAVGSSAWLGGINPHTENDNAANLDAPDRSYPYRAAFPAACENVNSSLLSKMGDLGCPEAARDVLGRLDETDRKSLSGIFDLWKSLGCPVSGFWLHTRVFCNRILDSYCGVGVAVPSNDQAHRQQPDGEPEREKGTP